MTEHTNDNGLEGNHARLDGNAVARHAGITTEAMERAYRAVRGGWWWDYDHYRDELMEQARQEQVALEMEG